MNNQGDNMDLPTLRGFYVIFILSCIFLILLGLQKTRERIDQQQKRKRRYALAYLPPSEEREIVPVEDDSFPDFWMALEKELDRKLTRDDALQYYLYEPMRQLYMLYPEQEKQASEPLDKGMEMVHSPLSVMAMAELMLHDDAYGIDDGEKADEEEAS